MRPVKTINDLFDNLSPETDERYIGIELEFYCRLEQRALARRVMRQPFAPHITLKSDGSIRPDACAPCEGRGCDTRGTVCTSCRGRGSEIGHEITVLVRPRELKRVIGQLCAALKKLGAAVNESCGLHVHLDMRHRDATKAWRNLNSVEGLLFRLVEPHRATSEYCRPSGYTRSLWEALDGNDRYCGINPQSLREHETIEIRMHQGSLDAQEIVNWVRLLSSIADSRRFTKTNVQTLVGLSRAMKLNPALKAYAKRTYREAA